MRVLLSTYGSRGDVEPLAGRAARSRAPGAEVRVCAPPVYAGFGGMPMRAPVDAAQEATAVAGTIRAGRAARPLLDALSRERPPVPA